MAGTKVGGKKAAATNKKRHGKSFYERIGRKGGQNGHTGGFASSCVGKDGLTGPQRAQELGRKGGLISRRGPASRDEDGNCITKDGRRYFGKSVRT